MCLEGRVKARLARDEDGEVSSSKTMIQGRSRCWRQREAKVYTDFTMERSLRHRNGVGQAWR